MDGVLLDTERPHIQIDVELAAEMGYRLPDELISKMFGATDGQIREYVRQSLGVDFDFETFSQESHRRIETLFSACGVPVKPGAQALLETLRHRGIPCAVASSSCGAIVRSNLDVVGFLGYFETIVGGDEAPASKPAPDIFLLAARKLGLEPDACLAVEDSYNGVRSAAAAGCATVMIPDMLPPNDEMKNLALAILTNLTQVPSFIDFFNAIKNGEKSDLIL